MKNKIKISYESIKDSMLVVLTGKFGLKNLKYLPRWVIFGIDLLVVFFAAILTMYLFKGIKSEYVSLNNTILYFSIYLLTNSLFFWGLRTFSGIIRHSSFIDAIKIAFSQLFVLFSLVVLNFCYYLYTTNYLFLDTGLFINCLLSFCLLFLYRVVIKQTFEIYSKDKPTENLIKALVYGSDANAISVCNALLSEVPTRFKIVGFIDNNSDNKFKRILNLPILNQKRRVSVLLRSVSAQALIIADKSLTKEQQLALVDECLEYNIRVYTVPLISDWENQKEISNKIKGFQIEDLLDRKPILLDNTKISNQLKNKVILITGAAGSIGSEIARQVIEFSPEIIILVDQAETPLHNLVLEINQLNKKCQIVPVIADVRCAPTLEHCFADYKPNVVYHAAAYKHVPLMEENPSQAIFVNVKGTQNLADLSIKYKVDKFVMVSTDKAVNPSNVMGASKRIAEKYVQSLYFYQQSKNTNSTKFITTRFGNVLGSNGSVVPLFTKQINEGGPVTITHEGIIRYFMTIPEACQLVLEAGSMGNGGEIYIFDMGKPVKIIDLAIKMIKLAGYTPNVDMHIKVIGLRPGEKLYEELLNDTSKTLPTHNEKIMVAQEQKDDFDTLKLLVAQLITEASTFDRLKVVQKMKDIVPEFKSMNSEFEKLDK